MIDELFKAIDASWKHPHVGKIPLRIIGCSALHLQTDYARGTSDGDILETEQLTVEIQSQLLDIAGKGSQLHRRCHLYVHFIGRAVPFFPRKAIYVPVARLGDELQHFSLAVLDVVDVVVSKLKPFRSHDIDDIRAMVDRGLIQQEYLIERFRSAMEQWELSSRAEELPRCIENLHTVERDMLFVKETAIELPSWMDR